MQRLWEYQVGQAAWLFVSHTPESHGIGTQDKLWYKSMGETGEDIN